MCQMNSKYTKWDNLEFAGSFCSLSIVIDPEVAGIFNRILTAVEWLTYWSPLNVSDELKIYQVGQLRICRFFLQLKHCDWPRGCRDLWSDTNSSWSPLNVSDELKIYQVGQHRICRFFLQLEHYDWPRGCLDLWSDTNSGWMIDVLKPLKCVRWTQNIPSGTT